MAGSSCGASLLRFERAGAVKRMPGCAPQSSALPVQAVIGDKDTWISSDSIFMSDVRSGSGGD